MLPWEAVDVSSLKVFKARLDYSEQPDLESSIPAHGRAWD